MRYQPLVIACLLVVAVSFSTAVAGPDDPVADTIGRVLESVGISSVAKRPDTAAPLIVITAVQDYARPTKDCCCHTHTPLRIGQQTFAKGIGAHANGKIVIQLKRPFRRLHARVGVDNNDDTKGKLGSVEFSVRVDGQPRYHSPCVEGAGRPIRWTST